MNALPTYSAEILRDLLSGRAIVRVRYRYADRGRWSRFTLLPDDGDTFLEVAAKIMPAIAAHATTGHHTIAV